MKKKILILIIAILLIVVAFIGINKLINKPVVEEVPELSEEEQAEILKRIEREEMSAFILRNILWEEDYNMIKEREGSNILDDGKDYITVDYESVFGEEHLPTYLFNGDELVAILYERVLNEDDKESLAFLHQKVASQIHFVYEKLYKEDFVWKNSKEKKYDNKLWNKSILSGELTMNSTWNGVDEKISLYTMNVPKFEFLFRDKEDLELGYQAFIVVSEKYLEDNSMENLTKIKPN